MGLLSLGTPLPWSQAKQHAEHVREHGIYQFLNIWERTKDKERDQLLWGDEIEYIVVDVDDAKRNAKLSLRQADILHALADDESLQRKGGAVPDLQPVERHDDLLPTFHPEYGRYMLEATPGAPYGHRLVDLLKVLPNMLRRRVIAKAHMKDSELPITLTSYPRLGAAGQFTEPFHPPTGKASRSSFVPDEVINPHVRFPTLTANIRERRGRKVAMNMPIFYDTNTPKPFIDTTIPLDRNLFPEDGNARDGAAKEGHIYMDSMAFGMGCCCLQITFQTKNVREARRLYDHLAPLGPIMLALTAASPAWRGYLSDVDARWNVISGAVDDRTAEELGEVPLKHDRFVIPKSRYDSISTYISEDDDLRPEYNDLDIPKDPKIRKILKDNGIDDRLADHLSHLFIRDPIVIFEELLDQDDKVSSDHFENIQSTNWQTMRFKPPPPDTDIGWRVEFRSMEIQITDYENAAFSIFIVLLTRAIISFKLNFYIPISKVDENMQVAHRRGAVLNEKFWFRTDVFPRDQPNGFGQVTDEYQKMTINEIINGKQDDSFPGLIPLIESYLNSVNCDVETRCELGRFLALVSKRASGKLQTAATWIRQFIIGHPDYKQDSVVNESINYDLVKAVEAMGTIEGRQKGIGKEMLGRYVDGWKLPNIVPQLESKKRKAPIIKEKKNKRVKTVTEKKKGKDKSRFTPYGKDKVHSSSNNLPLGERTRQSSIERAPIEQKNRDVSHEQNMVKKVLARPPRNERSVTPPKLLPDQPPPTFQGRQSTTLTPLQQKMAAKLSGAQFRWINEKLYTTTGSDALKLITEKPEMFDAYHAGFRSQVKDWPMNPIEIYRTRLTQFVAEKGMKKVVLDLGCGEAMLAKSVLDLDPSGKIIEMKSYDLKAANERIIAADIADLPLPDSHADIAIFCLALMGTDFLKFIQEAARVLKVGGQLWIAEIKSRMTDTDGSSFCEQLRRLGFVLNEKDMRNKMFITFDFTLKKKSKKEIEISSKVGNLLKPCTYKKR